VEGYAVKMGSAYLAWGSGVGGVKLCNQLWRMYIRSLFAAIVLIAVAFPMNKVLQSSLEHATIDNRLNLILLFSIH
jgi:hypothetical protein